LQGLKIEERLSGVNNKLFSSCRQLNSAIVAKEQRLPQLFFQPLNCSRQSRWAEVAALTGTSKMEHFGCRQENFKFPDIHHISRINISFNAIQYTK